MINPVWDKSLIHVVKSIPTDNIGLCGKNYCYYAIGQKTVNVSCRNAMNSLNRILLSGLTQDTINEPLNFCEACLSIVEQLN